jgi:hypothetical protein
LSSKGVDPERLAGLADAQWPDRGRRCRATVVDRRLLKSKVALRNVGQVIVGGAVAAPARDLVSEAGRYVADR